MPEKKADLSGIKKFCMDEMGDTEHHDRREDKWHVGKEIPLALIMMMVIQTIGAVWWAGSFQATVTTKLDDLSFQVAALTADKYTKTDAQKDGALYMQQISDMRDRINRLENHGARNGR